MVDLWVRGEPQSSPNAPLILLRRCPVPPAPTRGHGAVGRDGCSPGKVRLGLGTALPLHRGAGLLHGGVFEGFGDPGALAANRAEEADGFES